MTRDETIKGLCSGDISTFLSTLSECDETELEQICRTCSGPAAEAASDALAMRKRMEERKCTKSPKSCLEFGGKGSNR